jgi:hypothetical protein
MQPVDEPAAMSVASASLTPTHAGGEGGGHGGWDVADTGSGMRRASGPGMRRAPGPGCGGHTRAGEAADNLVGGGRRGGGKAAN